MKGNVKPASDKDTINELFGRGLKFKNTFQYMELLKFITKFTHYSYYNAMLVYLQNPKVEFFGSPGFWKKEFGRTVSNDARPYVALIPYGPCMLVYDIYDTEGEKSPEEIIDPNVRKGLFKVDGHLHPELYKMVEETVKSWGINVSRKFQRFNSGGYIEEEGQFSNPQIVIKEGMNDEESMKVMAHELGHLFMGHLGEKTLMRKRVTSKGKVHCDEKKIKARNQIGSEMQEIEAETISYLICSRIGLDMDWEKYLSRYLTDRNIGKIDIQEIITQADKIESIFLSKAKAKFLG